MSDRSFCARVIAALCAALAVSVGAWSSVASAEKPPPHPPASQQLGVLSAPGNDNFPGAAISGSSGCQAGDTAGGSLETDEPNINSETSSVWYTWTAPDANAATFNLYHLGASDNVLSAYRGTSMTDLLEEGASYQDGSYESILVSPTQAGDIFYIRVGSTSGHEGTFKLEWGDACTPPANDDFANAVALSTGLSGSIADQNVNKATLETDEWGVFENQTTDTNSVWYTWTPASSGDVMFRTKLDSLWDSTLAVYTGTSAAHTDLTEIAVNDDYPVCCASLVSFSADSGTTYRIRVSGYASMGQLDLEWSPDFVRPDTSVGPASGQGAYDNSSPVQFEVTFSEPVTGFDATDVDTSLSTATVGTPTVQADPDNNDGAHYVVDVPFSSSDGYVALWVPGDIAADAYNNGNNAAPENSAVFIDTSDPSVGVSGKVQGSKVTVTIATIDNNGVSSIECAIDAGSYQPCNSTFTVNLSKGQHTIHARATDVAGNEGSASTTVTIKSGKIKI